MFRDFERRLQRDLRRLVDARTDVAAHGVDVAVVSHPWQRYAVWYGASVLGASAGFQDTVVTRAQYMECGPSVVRKNVVFTEW
jgi:actin-related protein 3